MIQRPVPTRTLTKIKSEIKTEKIKRNENHYTLLTLTALEGLTKSPPFYSWACISVLEQLRLHALIKGLRIGEDVRAFE